jgi:hypothetical protein
MLARLLGVAFGAKATALSGALIVASAILTSATPGADVAPAAEPAQLPLAALSVAAPPAPRTPVAESSRKPEPTSPPTPLAVSACTSDPQAQRDALAAIRSAYSSAQAALDRLGSERTSSRAAEALDRADGMLTNIDRAAEDLAARGGACAADVREVTARTTHAMEMIVDLAKSATAPTPTPQPVKRSEAQRKRH